MFCIKYWHQLHSEIHNCSATSFLFCNLKKRGNYGVPKFLVFSSEKCFFDSASINFDHVLPISWIAHVYCWALATSSMKIRDIVVQPVSASVSLWPLLQLPTQNPTRTFPLWMLLQWPSMWRSLFFPMIHMKYVVFMSLWPRTIKILISNWPRTPGHYASKL